MSDATEISGLPGQFKVTHTHDTNTGYTQLCITLRDSPDDTPIVIVDGVRGDVHVGVYDEDRARVRIDHNGAEAGGPTP